MRIKKGFQIHSVGKDAYAVAATPELAALASMIKLNETAEFLFRQLEEDKTEEELTAALAGAFEISADAAKADVAAFCRKLQEGGFLV